MRLIEGQCNATEAVLCECPADGEATAIADCMAAVTGFKCVVSSLRFNGAFRLWTGMPLQGTFVDEERYGDCTTAKLGEFNVLDVCNDAHSLRSSAWAIDRERPKWVQDTSSCCDTLHTDVYR